MVVIGKYEDTGKPVLIPIIKLNYVTTVRRKKDLPMMGRRTKPKWAPKESDRKRYQPNTGDIFYLKTDGETIRYCWLGRAWAILCNG
tara:strand:+ start:1016 stop:1276 length:261 start_codon:yes stop_codon:yes gene_type:complete